jgi:uncharacterized membrane protein
LIRVREGYVLHLIPESWSHLHILVSVFPSVGLLFLIGLYVTAIIADNEGMKRTCLVVFGILGLLAIPTYMSGDGSSEALLSQNPAISQDKMDKMDTHYYWGMFALGLIVLTGLAAWIALWRFRSARVSDNSVHLVLGLAIITFVLMAVAGEFGWEINHRELQVSVPPELANVATPQIWSHIHMILNHVPTIGFTFALGFYIVALVIDNVVMKRSSLVLFVICAIFCVPTYVTGAASMWALTQPPMPGISKGLINAHRDMALLTLFGVAFTGGAAWLELWRFRYIGRFSTTSLYVVLALAVITFGVMAETGHRGGQINHPEIRVAADELPIIQAPNQDAGWWTPAIEKLINNVIFFVPWQTVHFFGYSLIFGTVLAVALRVLGFWKSLPFSAVHRLLPIGFFGVMMNVFTGMLMMLADTYRYVVTDTTFAPKMAFIPIGVMAILYFSVSDAVWNVKAGEDAPLSAKWVASLVLLAWTGVIMGGRLLPYV